VHDAMESVGRYFESAWGVFVINPFQGYFVVIYQGENMKRLGKLTVWAGGLDYAEFVEDPMIGSKGNRQVVVFYLKYFFY